MIDATKMKRQIDNTLELSILESPVYTYRTDQKVKVTTRCYMDKNGSLWEDITMEYDGMRSIV